MSQSLPSGRGVAPVILFLKAKIAGQAGYYLLNGRWHKLAQDTAAPAEAHHVVTSHYHVLAVKKLKGSSSFKDLSPADQIDEVKGFAAKMQSAASASAAVSMWKKAAMSGKNPTPAQWKAFHALPQEQKEKLLEAATGANAGSTDHLKDPGGPVDEAPAPAAPDPKTIALASVDWAALSLPDTNTNAASVNKKVAALKAATEAGDAAAVAAIKTGTNTYNLKIEAAKQKVLAALGGAPAPAAPPKVVSATVKKPAAPEPKESAGDMIAKMAADKVAKVKAALEAVHAAGFGVQITPNHGLLFAPHKGGMAQAFATEDAASSVVGTLNNHGINAQVVGDQKPFFVKVVGVKQSLESAEPPKVASVSVKPAAQTVKVDAPLYENTTDGHSKFWSVSVYGNKLKTEYGKIGTMGQSTVKEFPSHDAAIDAAIKLKNDKQAKGYAYKGSVQHEHEVAGAAPATDTGPKDGDTKEGADGTLVFKSGRWHKVADLAAAAAKPQGPVDVDIPDFGDSKWGKNYAMVARALKAAAVESGKDGLKGKVIVHKVGHKAGNFTLKAAGFSLQNVGPGQSGANGPLREKMHAFVGELIAATAAKKGAKKKAPKVVSATFMPAPAAAPGAPINIDGWKQVDGQKGSNPGGVFEAPDGARYYVKFPADPDHAKNEVLAAKLYELAGVTGPISRIADRDGKVGIASLMDPTLKHDAAALSAGKVHSVKAGFAADAWLANYDVAGLAFDNVMVKPNGQAVRIDVGAGMEYRAQGKKKDFGPKVTENKTLLDPAVNAQSAAMFAGITPADITAGVAKIAAIDDDTLRATVMKYGPGDAANRKNLADTLIARKADLLAQYPAAKKAIKKRLDPTKLPVDASKLPAPHDFANWNGPGKGLSSKAHVNNANAAVEQEMFALAKAGNLPDLQNFKYHALDKETGLPTGEALPIANHPSKHVVQYHEDLVQVLREIAHPPRPLKLFNTTDAATLEALDEAFPPKPMGVTVGKVKSNEKLGFWVVLGGVTSVDKIKPKKDLALTSKAIAAAHAKYHEAPKLAKHFIDSVQASGSYNDLFRAGKTHDGSGNALTDVAKAALAYSTTQPEGTTIYRWQQMTDAMVQKVLSAPDGTVIQATGPMCTSYDPTATQHFGKHRVVIRYAQGARAVESFGSGHYQGEKEVTTLPNARFVVLSKHMVKSGSGQRLELDLLMLPPDIGVAGT